MTQHFYKVLIYNNLRGYVAGSNVKRAKNKVIKDKKYKPMLWHGKRGISNLKLEKVI
jgi:hypothetical protein